VDRDRVALIDSAGASEENGGEYKLLDAALKAKRLALLQRKGVMAYDYVRGGSRQLFNQLGLPPRAEFFNVLTQQECAEEDYAHAENVFNTFNCKTFLDYSMIYNTSDVFLLAEAVEDMRKRVFDQFGLDMTMFFSFPHMSKQLMLKFTKAQPEMISDYAMADLLRSGIRGGLAYCNQRLIKLHKKVSEVGGLTETFLDEDCTIPACLAYFDENNLYGYVSIFIIMIVVVVVVVDVVVVVVVCILWYICFFRP